MYIIVRKENRGVLPSFVSAIVPSSRREPFLKIQLSHTRASLSDFLSSCYQQLLLHLTFYSFLNHLLGLLKTEVNI